MRLTQIELVYRVLKERKLFEARDKHTRCTAGYYTTDKNLFNRADERQLKLFGEGE